MRACYTYAPPPAFPRRRPIFGCSQPDLRRARSEPGGSQPTARVAERTIAVDDTSALPGRSGRAGGHSSEIRGSPQRPSRLTWARDRFLFPLSVERLSILSHGDFPTASCPCHGGRRPGRFQDGASIVFRAHSMFAKSKTFLLQLHQSITGHVCPSPIR